MAHANWLSLSPRTRRTLVIAGSIEGVLKIAALADLWRRPSDQINGSKKTCAAAIVTVNSAGIVPILFLARGRRS